MHALLQLLKKLQYNTTLASYHLRYPIRFNYSFIHSIIHFLIYSLFHVDALTERLQNVFMSFFMQTNKVEHSFIPTLISLFNSYILRSFIYLFIRCFSYSITYSSTIWLTWPLFDHLNVSSLTLLINSLVLALIMQIRLIIVQSLPHKCKFSHIISE